MSIIENVQPILNEENHANLDQLIQDSKAFVIKARDYAAENPLESAGLACVAIGVVWAMTFTQPGRNVLSRFESLTVNQLNRWLTKNLKPLVTH